MQLRAGRFTLRRLTPSDIDAVVAACQDTEMARFVPFIPVPYTVDDAREWLAKVDRAWGQSDERTFAIIDHSQDESFQGVVTVRLHERGTVGYWLAPWARGRGVMAECVRRIVDWARHEQGIEQLLLMTHPDNLASQRVAERAGFKRIGETDQHDSPFRDGSTTAVLFELR
ncbi:MAG TPA: GNAT family N-acetyltransferase [Gaiellaceae bacterium]|nr:GNAT family N-acetyltransferase [Gaiellaceae bacterium]